MTESGVDGPESQDAEKLFTVVQRRSSIFNRILSGTHRRSELASEADSSRTTVYRGLEELAELNLVTGANDDYVPTNFGRIVFQQVQDFNKRLDNIQAARDLISELPSVEPEVGGFLIGAEIARPNPVAPLNLVGELSCEIQAATTVQILTRVIHPRVVGSIINTLKQEESEVEMVLGHTAIEHLSKNFLGHLSEDVLMGQFSILSSPNEPSFGLIIVEEPKVEDYFIIYDGRGNICGYLRNDTVKAHEWAKSTYAEYREKAEEIEMRGEVET